MKNTSPVIVGSLLVASFAVGNSLNVSFAQGSFSNDKAQQTQIPAVPAIPDSVDFVESGEMSAWIRADRATGNDPLSALLQTKPGDQVRWQADTITYSDNPRPTWTLVGHVQRVVEEGGKQVSVMKAERVTIQAPKAALSAKEQASKSIAQSGARTILLDGKPFQLNFPPGTQAAVTANEVVTGSNDITFIGNVRIIAKEGDKEILLAKGDKAILEYGPAPVVSNPQATK